MTRSHVLLYYPSAKVRAAREEAWEGKGPGSIRVLLSKPRWERRLLRFSELSAVWRVMKDGIDEEETCAARLEDGWVTWEMDE